MEYGVGFYLGGGRKYQGKICLDDKLYIKGEEDYPETYIPLEKIKAIRIKRGRMQLKVNPSLLTAYTATIGGDRKELKRLIKNIVKKLGLKKKFLKSEWVGETYSR